MYKRQVRRASDFSLCETGEEGILQVQSILPESYPGHSLLTEDRGVLLGDCLLYTSRCV